VRQPVSTDGQVDTHACPLHEIQTEKFQRQLPNEETSLPKTAWATGNA
jgi:hypothetical protein